MQLDSYSADEKDGSLFEQYLAKTFKKTASLMAHSCQAVRGERGKIMRDF